ncbi:hypothetical protein M513_07664 [Trichuris suis]|uniref:Uncharacterized protein n=1 Tax=Trichuris suis TaxID=68888 RepID=A0A085M2K5_9BILA|nr:hypothetical protein M513_07664 [Trichuris suis]
MFQIFVKVATQRAIPIARKYAFMTAGTNCWPFLVRNAQLCSMGLKSLRNGVLFYGEKVVC